MTETKWLTSGTLRPMSEYLRFPHTCARKRWLLACASCRRIWHLLRDERSRRLIELRERHSVGLASEHELLSALDPAGRARDEARSFFRTPDGSSAHSADAAFAWAAAAASTDSSAAIGFVIRAASNTSAEGWRLGAINEEAAICTLVREIFGNPFRPTMVDSQWLTSDVLALSRGIYTDYAFDRMPILADALQDAGCDNTDILDHCRGPGPHVRGCWVVDLILGKE